jgi:lipopolysaccharide/colanic/teichoic acid biosynthesis glycosyltransferase
MVSIPFNWKRRLMTPVTKTEVTQLRGVQYWADCHFEASQSRYLNGRAKRCLDISLACVGILVGFPLFFLAVIITALIDHVPPIFAQERLGFGGQPFTLYKLRTLAVIETRDMVNVARMQSKPHYQTTRTGQFWRTHSIDEIVQFWLVLKGEMSLIGHRPIPMYYVPHLYEMAEMTPQLVEKYLATISAYKPGMSSLSAVNGRGDLTMQHKMEYDLLYAQQASFWNDIRLIGKSIIAVLTCRGAR